MSATGSTAPRTEQQPKRVALYVRISSDRADDELGVKRQDKECRAYIKRRPGWTLAETYIDNDVSADVGSKRPAWQRLLDDVRAGKIDVILGWSLDRLTRQPIELEGLIELAERDGLSIVTVQADFDLGSDIGQLVARILVAFAKNELKARRARQLAERRQHAESGKAHMGGHRPYGYAANKVDVNETEAVVIREAAQRVLAGESLRGICADFAERGIAGTTGRPFTMNTLRQILLAARISGRREHWQGAKGEKRPTLAPIVGEGEWAAIISAEDSDALRSILTKPERRTGHGNARKRLLPGFLFCATCERPMASHKTRRRGNAAPRPTYACARTPEKQACRKEISGIPLEARVVDLVLTAVESPKLAKLLEERSTVDTTVVTQLALDIEERDELAAMRSRGDLTMSEWKIMRAELSARIEDAEAIINEQAETNALFALMNGPGTIEERWEKLSLDQRRSVLGTVVDKIIVHPPSKMGRVFDNDRVQIIWAV